MPAALPSIYDPAQVDIERLADLLLHLSPEQREALEIRLDPEAMRMLEDSRRDLDSNSTVPLDEW